MAHCPRDHDDFIRLVNLLCAKYDIAGVTVAVDPAALPARFAYTRQEIGITLVATPAVELPASTAEYSVADVQRACARPLAVRASLVARMGEAARVLFIDFEQTKLLAHWVRLCETPDDAVYFVPQRAFTQQSSHITMADPARADPGTYPALGGDMACAIYPSATFVSVPAVPCQIGVKTALENGGVGSARTLVGIGYGWCKQASERGIEVRALVI